MSVVYRSVGWNRQKRLYDLAVAVGAGVFAVAYAAPLALRGGAPTAETIAIRTLGATAFGMIHAILAIGPLARIDPRFRPLLYNRRHLGVAMCLVACAHGAFSLFQFHALGDLNPFVSLFMAGDFLDPGNFPFQVAGAFALSVFVAMAATSHDFWLAALTPPVWKTLHMGVYFAYAATLAHVAFGAYQSDSALVPFLILAAGPAALAGLHLAAAIREHDLDLSIHEPPASVPPHADFADACAIDEIPQGRAKIVRVAGERVAIFRHGDRVSAISNVCRHQNGPLGEGCIVGGLVVCPWHGYEYDPTTGASPPPFHEKVPTFDVLARDGRVLVALAPNPPGTYAEPLVVGAGEAGAASSKSTASGK